MIQVRSPLDVDALQRFIARFQKGKKVAAVEQFGHGQSNPTFLVSVLSTSPPISGSAMCPADLSRMVLRKKPPGQILTSAHAVEREHAVLSALSRYKGSGEASDTNARTPTMMSSRQTAE